MKKEKFFKKPAVIRAIGIVALVGGIYFLKSNLTGNIIKEGGTNFSILFLIGLSLMACSIVLVVHSIKKK